jgi:hypothetical protein
MRDSEDALDRQLAEVGARWRAAQPEPRAVTPGLFSENRASRFELGWGTRAWAFVAGAASAVAFLVVIAVSAPGVLPRIDAGGPGATAATGGGYIPTGVANCPLTRPDPSFTPPPAPGADFDLGPDRGWYGSPRLWTWLANDGERWTGLTRSELGFSAKTFWWRQGYSPRAEPIPQIFVTGDRLDGPGRLGFGPGTNASFSQGASMLVGIEIPETGCWKLTAHYGMDSLSIVVWVQQG